MSDQRLARIKEKGIEEITKFFWIFLYLWILLGLFAVHKAIILNEKYVLYHEGFAVINAFVLAKIVLVADMFHIGDSVKDKPLIYPIIFRSLVFSVILMSFHIIEEIIVGMWHGKNMIESIPAVGGGSLKGILVVGLIVFIVLMPFFALREIGIVVGNNKLYELFFVRRTKFVPKT
jgi:hypothetical protein